MGLQETKLSFLFQGGIETKMDGKAVPASRLLVLENGVFTKAISIKKRNGYTALRQVLDGSDTLLTGAKKLATRDDELLQLVENRCYSYHESADQWIDTGAVIAATSTDRGSVQTSSQQTTPDHATYGDIAVFAWEDSRGGVWWTTENAVTGAVYRVPTQADANGQRPRCVAVGTNLHVYYAVPTSSSLMCIVVNPSQPSAAVTPVTLTGDLNATNPAYDALPTARTERPAFLAWHEAGSTNIRVSYVHASGALGSPVLGTPAGGTIAASIDSPSPIAVAFQYVDGTDSDRALVEWKDTTDIVRVWTGSGGTASPSVLIGATFTATAQAFASGEADQLALVTAGSEVWAVVEKPAAGILVAESDDRCEINHFAVGSAGDQSATVRTQRSVSLASRAFQAGADEDTFAVFVHKATFFNTFLTLRLSDSADAGRHLPAQAFWASMRQHLPSVHVSDDVASVSLPYAIRLKSENNDKFGEAGIRQVRIDFDNPDARQTAQIGRGLYMAGACPQHYDGRVWTEQGFHVGPNDYTATPGAGGSLPNSATYLYYAWYEWTDNQGEIHRGPLSPGIVTGTGPAQDQITLTLPTLRITRKTNVRICVARSLNGDTSRLWRVSSLDPTTAGSPNGYLANSTTTDTVSFVDRMSDTDVQKEERLYTTGGVLSNDPTALGSHIVAGKNRLFFTDCGAGSIIRYSQRLATGYGVEIAPELQHDIDPYGGDITALGIMDDVVFVFKRSCIFAFNGDGPLETGGTATQGFSSSQLITSDVGCTSPSSVVLTPNGLMFKSAKGIYMIGRDRVVKYIGAPAELYNTQDVTRAIVMPDRTSVVFLTSSGLALNYDYLFDQWSTFTNHEGLDGCVVRGTFHYLRTNGLVYKETPGVYLDNGLRIPFKLETAWIHFGDHLQGFVRFWKLLLLGTWVSPHQLGISHRTNYVQDWSPTWWLDATGGTDPTGWLSGDDVNPVGEDPILGSSYGDGVFGDGPYGGTADDIYQWRYGIHENGQSVQFRFEDYEKADIAGASFELTEMTIVGGAEKVDIRPFSGSRST